MLNLLGVISAIKIYQYNIPIITFLKLREVRVDFVWMVSLSTIIFFLFKYFYPYPNFSPDSHTYIITALYKEQLTLWPIGYPKFLQYFSFFTRKDDVLVYLQYIFLMLSVFYLLETIRHFSNISKSILLILYILLAVNPLILQLANFVGPDAIFTGFSILWIAHLFWIVIKPSPVLVISHSVLLLLLCLFRYNGMWYPVLSILVIICTSLPKKLKFLSIVLIVLLQAAFVVRNYYYYKKIVGVSIINAFGGWQLASNGLNAYAHAPTIDANDVPAEFFEIHRIVNEHLAVIKTLSRRPDSLITTYYLWDNDSPLRRYLINKHRRNYPGASLNFKEWAEVSPLFMSYGKFLIRHAPLEYIRYFICPNLVYFFTPSGEYLMVYNSRKDFIDKSTQIWFNYKENKVKTFFKDKDITTMWFVSLSVGIFNCLFLLSAIGFFCINGFKISSREFAKIIFLAILAFLGNMLFNVIASGIILRYEVFSFVLTFVFSVILLTFLSKLSLKGLY